jgi:diaminohydroxyphosphoribosylaminopyrimidine deaminase/5-amino-6-(5-phosphoribosylamino)uracil reductase
VDAVAVGIGTAMVDDPMLNARDVSGEVRQPVRVVFDAQARLPLDGALVRSASEIPVIDIVGDDADRSRVDALRRAGVEVVALPGGPRERIEGALEALGANDVQSLFLEGGPILAEAFVAAGAVDRVAWFVAPILVGGAGAPGALGGMGLGPLGSVPRLDAVEVSRVGDDVLIAGRLRPLPEA